MRRILLSVAICFLFNASLFSQIKILFDATKAETAANADWIIDADAHNMGWNSSGGYTCTCSSTESNAQRLPTPAQSGVTSSTAETFWQGCLSHWAIDCVNKGYHVETLPFGTALTYGITSNPQDLSNYNIFVVDEPNVLFTAAEKTALMNFINNGGGLVMIADHDVSDRNGDGYDSPHIWNDFITNNGVNNTGLGFKFELENFSDASSNSNVSVTVTDSITKGSYGIASQVKWSGGTCMTKYPAQNSSVKGHVWKNGKGQTDTAVCVLTAKYGCGRIAAFGDSSPMDDGTGDPNDNSLYDGYTTDASGAHQKLLMNTMIWLAQSTCAAGIEQDNKSVFLNIYPNPASNIATVVFTNDTELRPALSVYSISGQLLDVPQEHNKTGRQENISLNTSGLNAGIYYCKLVLNNQVFTHKLIVTKP